MVTRRVKRIKRSKNKVHRSRDRKTNRRRKTNRHTRRQRGGEFIKVCSKSGPFEALASGIDITYNTDTHKFKIGTQSSIKELESFKGAARYAKAVFILKQMKQTNVELDWLYFAFFATLYCRAYADETARKQCESIKQFINDHRNDTADAVPDVAARSINYVIIDGENLGNASYWYGPVDKMFPPDSGAASGAASGDAASAVPNMSRNELMVSSGMIAYNNNKGVMTVVTADKSKTEYEFDNFIIPIRADEYDPPDHIISGKLTVKFVPGPHVVTAFTLELNVDPTESLIECMNRSVIGTVFVTIDTIVSSKPFFGTSKMVITGTLMEQKDYTLKKSTYDLNSFVMNFAKRYQECLDPATQMAGIRVSGPADVALAIKSKIAMLALRQMSPKEKTSFEALKQQFASAGGNLVLLNQISVGMDQLADARRARVYPSSGASGPVMSVVPVVPVVPASAEEKLARLLAMDND